jgi:DNA polymerase-3 subunit alpha
MAPRYVPLRVHSEYSVVSGLGTISALVSEAKNQGFPSFALTDECNAFAAIKFYKEALAAEIKPIFGSDFLLQTDKQPARFTLLCQNQKGFKSLTQLISKAYLESARVDGIPLLYKNWLTAEACEGLIALSGGLESELTPWLLKGELATAKKLLASWLKVFSEDRFYLEIARLGMREEESYISQVLPLAAQMGLPVVATHPSYFLKDADFMAHEVRVAINKGYTLEDPNRPKNFSQRQYLVDEAYMLEHFANLPQALENSVELAKRCNLHFTLGKVFLPSFPTPPELTEEAYFKKVSYDGLEKRLKIILAHADQEKYAEEAKKYHERLALELDVIIKMGFSGYFLIVADFIQWSKNNGVPVGPGRGSGAGSIVAYALNITDLDPLPYDLLFERFLNPERVSMPDFDVDFCVDGRDRVIEYVAEKYGRQAVSQIITFGTMAAKAVVRDVGRVLGLPYGFVDGIAKLIPLDLGMTLTQALTQEPQLQKRYEAEEDVKNLIDMALRLEGTVRNVGKHAGGVVIAPSSLTDFSPIYCEEDSKQIVTQYDKDDVESVGLVKFDFLGLRNLTIIQEALNTIHKIEQNKKFDINLIPLNDVKTYDLLKKGETTAVFQLESRGMKELIKRLKPDCFEDIIALVALFRPGPLQSGMVDDFIQRKHGHAKIEYPHPLTAAILKPTYGIILYQEQVMLIAQVLAGYTLGAADLLRRAMGKKKPEEMAKQRSIFIEGSKNNQINEATANAIFDLMEKFAGYGFNKSHSAAYALLAYQTAYLKAHYPAAFMAAVLSSDMDNTDKIVGFIDECKEMHLKILPPDIHQSQYAFKVVDTQTIRYGLGAIKGVGRAAIDFLFNEREQGPFEDLFALCQRSDLRKINKRVLEALIASGALDALGPNRATLLKTLELAMQQADQHERAAAIGQEDFFGMDARSDTQKTERAWLMVSEFSVYERVMLEKQVLGWCLSGHPLDEYRNLFRELHLKPIRDLQITGRNESTKFGGIITDIRRIKTKKGSHLLILSVEDFTQKMEVTCFSDTMDEYQDLLKPEALLVFEAEISVDDFSGGLRAVARKIYELDSYKTGQAKCIRIWINSEQAERGAVLTLTELFQTHKGSCPIELIYTNNDAEVTLKLDPTWAIHLNDEVSRTLKSYRHEVKFN